MRLSALIKRYRGEVANNIVHFGSLIINQSAHKVTREGVVLTLTPVMFQLLVQLIKVAPDVVSRETLINAVWGDEVPDKDLLRGHFVFYVIALVSTFLVFFSFSLHLIFNEDRQIEKHLKSFESIAIDHYTLTKDDKAALGPYVQAYYSVTTLTDAIRAEMPYEEGMVTIVDRFYGVLSSFC